MESVKKISLNIAAPPASNPVHESATDELTDRELVAQCQQGELDVYEHVVNRYRQRVYALAFSMLRNEQDAVEVAQETFVRAWQNIGKFRLESSVYTWLYRITTNQCIDRARRRDRRAEVALDDAVDPATSADAPEPPSTNPSPVDEVQHRELGRQIDAALRELSPEHRAVIQLREFEGLEYAEIAAAIGCNVGTVMSRLFYARKHLQKILKEQI
jgi:RNA polymerase sigma-70 factor (ECF subfamily)